MIGKREDIARLQSDLFRDHYHRLLNVLLVESVIILLLILAIIYFTFFQPPSKYYATTSEGQVIPMTAAKLSAR